MRFAVFGDLHLKPRDYETRLLYVARMLETAREGGCQAVLCTGDVFHSARVGDRNVPAPRIIGALTRVITAGGLPWLIAKGNHDGEGPGAGALAAVADLPMVRVFHGEPQGLLLGGVPLLVVPWQSWDGHPKFSARCLDSLRRAAAKLAEAVGEDAPILMFGHMSVAGAVCGNRPVFSVSGGDDPRWVVKPADLSGLGLKWVCLGHVHKRQHFGIEGVKLAAYVGALTRLTHGEAEHADGWCLLDTSSQWKATWVEANGPRYATGELADARPGVDVVQPARPERSAGPDREVLDFGDGAGVEKMWETWCAKHPLPPEYDALGYGAHESQILLELHDRVAQKARRTTPAITQIFGVALDGFGRGRDRHVGFKPGWNALLGPNGSGKTTCLEAVYAALFGRWPSAGRGHWASSSATPEQARVVALFESGKRWWKVERGPGATMKVSESGPDAGDSRWETRATGTAPATAYCAEHFGDAAAWLRLCLLSGTAENDLVDATDAARMKALRALLQLDELEQMAAEAAEFEKKLPPSEVSAWKAVLERTRAERPGLVSAANEAAALAEEFQAGVTGALAEWETAEAAHAAVRDTDVKLAAEETALASITLALQAYARSAADYEKQTAGAREWDAAQAKIHKLRPALREAEAEWREYRGLFNQLEQAEALSRPVGQAKCGECPFIPDAQAAARRAEVLREDIASRENPEARVAQLQAELKACEGVARYEHPMDLEEVRARAQEAEQRHFACQARVAELQQQTRPGLEADRAQWVAEARKKHDAAKALSDEAVAAWQAARAALQANYAAESEAEKRVQGCVVSEWQRVACRRLQEGFGPAGIPQQLIARALPELNAALAEALEEAEFDAEVRMGTLKQLASGELREGLPIHITWPTGESYDVREASDGEKALIRLAIRCALITRRATSAGVALLDEPTARMAPQFQEGAFQMLRTMGASFGQVIVATHDDELAEEVGSKITLGAWQA